MENILTNPLAGDMNLDESRPKISHRKPLNTYLDVVTHSSLEQVSIEDFTGNAIIKIDNTAEPIIKREQKPTKDKEIRLSITLPPLPEIQNTLADIQNINSNALLRAMSEKLDGDFNKETIERWNNLYGGEGVREKVIAKIKQMRELGGLDVTRKSRNIPSARLGLCLLAGYKGEQDLKMYALESLLAILKNDDFSKESSYRLVDLATELLNLISRKDIQTEDLDTEIKLTEIYKVLSETLYIHAGCEHFNGITKEKKTDLINAATAIAKLNRLDNVKIRFNISCAREWLRWLKDDTQELYVLAKKLYNLVLAGGALYFDSADEGYARLERALKIKDPHLPKHPWHWHNALSVLRDLARDVKAIKLHTLTILDYKESAKDTLNVITNSDNNNNNNNNNSNEKKTATKGTGEPTAKSRAIINPDFKVTINSDFNISGSDLKTTGSDLKNKKQLYHSEMIRLLALIHKKHAKLDWKFSYGAIEVLFDLVLNGKTPEIRMQAFKGISFRGNSSAKNESKLIELPGLKYFASCKSLGRYLKTKNMVHLELPEVASQNKIIREACAEYLIELIKQSKDEAIVRKATRLLSDRALYENDASIRHKIENFLINNSIEYSPRKKEKKLMLSLRGS